MSFAAARGALPYWEHTDDAGDTWWVYAGRTPEEEAYVWREARAGRGGRKFYVNKATRAKVWVLPKEGTAAAPVKTPAKKTLVGCHDGDDLLAYSGGVRDAAAVEKEDAAGALSSLKRNFSSGVVRRAEREEAARVRGDRQAARAAARDRRREYCSQLLVPGESLETAARRRDARVRAARAGRNAAAANPTAAARGRRPPPPPPSDINTRYPAPSGASMPVNPIMQLLNTHAPRRGAQGDDGSSTIAMGEGPEDDREVGDKTGSAASDDAATSDSASEESSDAASSGGDARRIRPSVVVDEGDADVPRAGCMRPTASSHSMGLTVSTPMRSAVGCGSARSILQRGLALNPPHNGSMSPNTPHPASPWNCATADNEGLAVQSVGDGDDGDDGDDGGVPADAAAPSAHSSLEPARTPGMRRKERGEQLAPVFGGESPATAPPASPQFGSDAEETAFLQRLASDGGLDEEELAFLEALSDSTHRSPAASSATASPRVLLAAMGDTGTIPPPSPADVSAFAYAREHLRHVVASRKNSASPKTTNSPRTVVNRAPVRPVKESVALFNRQRTTQPVP